MEEPLSNNFFMIDEAYEFSAPRFYDFVNGETNENTRKSELWFDGACSYAPFPLMPKITATRSIQLQTLCDFVEVDEIHKAQGSSEAATVPNCAEESVPKTTSQTKPQSEIISEKIEEVKRNIRPQVELILAETKQNNLEVKKALDVEEGICTRNRKPFSRQSFVLSPC